jgi:AGCS family alanine or glycine:cation symporter
MKAWTTLFGRTPTSEFIFKMIFCSFVVVGATVNFTSVLDFADAMLFICAIPNLLACYLLLPKVREEVRDFREGRRNGTIVEVPAAERTTS